ncbi:hypothetical protein BASA81_000431 [Batrachochytrium salamandrivorans]|nr:hypothetical protein BASA81_000421 [Batrachochytrium salamandrivorans]KAH9261775.1 hypothetical protein BASA81_000431 [Batrachochytrium salamandrivorans]
MTSMSRSNSNISLGSEGEAGHYRGGRWTALEHKLFVQAYKTHGKNWIKVSSIVATRSNVQCRTHAQNYDARGSCGAAPFAPSVAPSTSPSANQQHVLDSFRKQLESQRALLLALRSSYIALPV